VLDNVRFDTFFRCMVWGWKQVKTGKYKPVHVFPGKNWRYCPLHALFCHLVMTAGDANSAASLNFVCGEMHTGSAPSTKVSAGIHQFKKHSDHKNEVDPRTTAKVYVLGTTQLK
jgi:hypothetical protein